MNFNLKIHRFLPVSTGRSKFGGITEIDFDFQIDDIKLHWINRHRKLL